MFKTMLQSENPPPDLAGMLALESSVWEALVRGDAEADRAALSPDFLGVYPSGFSDREGHVSQLDAGPSVAEYALSEARVQVYAPDLVMLSYRARFRRGQEWQEMYVSSLWQREGPGWRNLFSQDTPVAGL